MRMTTILMRRQFFIRIFRFVLNFFSVFILAIADFNEFVITQLELGYTRQLDIGDIHFYMGLEDSIPIYCNDKALILSGIPKRIPAAIATIDHNNKPIVVVNGTLLEGPLWMLEALIQQQIGHIYLHFDKDISSATIGKTMRKMSKLRSKYEADEYAALTTGMLRSLRVLQEHGRNVKKRIIHLQNIHLA